MRTGTGGLKDGSGVVLLVCTSQSEGDDVLRQYRAVNQNEARFDILTDLSDAQIALSAYPAGTKWCVPGDAPAWFNEAVRLGFNRTFGAQWHTSHAIAAFTDEYAIDPKLLRMPTP